MVPIPGLPFLTKWTEGTMVGSRGTAQGCQAGLEGACDGKDEGTRAYPSPSPANPDSSSSPFHVASSLCVFGQEEGGRKKRKVESIPAEKSQGRPEDKHGQKQNSSANDRLTALSSLILPGR